MGDGMRQGRRRRRVRRVPVHTGGGESWGGKVGPPIESRYRYCFDGQLSFPSPDLPSIGGIP